MPIPLDTWRRTIGYNPYHFWQQANSLVPVTSSCNTLIYQYAWQSLDQAGRDDVQQAIDEAHETLREWLQYRIGEQHVTKKVQYPLTQTDQWKTLEGNGRLKSLNVGEGFIKAMGVPLYAQLEDGAAVTYSDENGDGVTDTFTLTATIPTGLTYDRLIVSFDAADWLDGWELLDAEIQPVNISASGATVTITGSSYLLVKPLNYEGVTKQTFDPNETGALADIFAQTLDVWAVRTDCEGQEVTDAPAVLHYEARGWQDWYWGIGLCPDGVYMENATVTGVGDTAVLNVPVSANIRDARRGAIYFSHWKQPDRVTLRYRAGASITELNETGIHAAEWTNIVSRLATARMPNRVCACDTANRRLWDWQFDRARAAGANDEQYMLSESDLANPFGTRAGEIYAWHKVRQLSLTRAFVL